MGLIFDLIVSVAALAAFVVLFGRRRITPAKTITYCPQCTAVLERRELAGRQRVACPRCNFVHWDNPKPVVVTLIPKDGGLVLVKRKLNPRAGFWALPGGFVEGYEEPDEAAAREVREETSLTVEIDRLLDAFAPTSRTNEIILFYLAKPTTATPEAGDDALEVKVFHREDIADIAFESHQKMMIRWFDEQEARNGSPE